MRLPDPVRKGMRRLLESDAAARGEQPPVLPDPPPAAPPLPVRLTQWLSEATAQMRWKRARPYAAKELAAHLADQYEAFQEQGLDETHAAQATIREMGDAVQTGTALDRAWRPAPDWVMLGLVLAVALVGKVMQYLIAGVGGYPVAANESQVQILQYLAGMVCLFAGYFADYTWLGKHPRLTYTVWVAIMAAAFWRSPIMSGKWYYPEYTLWLFPIVFAAVLYAQRGKGTEGVAACVAAMLPMMVMAELIPSTSGLLMLVLVCSVLLCSAVLSGAFGGKRKRQLALALSPAALIAAAAGWLICNIPHIWDRVAVIWNPTLDMEGHGYMGSALWEALFGGVVPAGLRENRLELVHLEGATNYLLTAAKLKWGWAAFALVLAVLLVLLARGLRLARRQSGVLAKAVSWAVMLTFACQTVTYVLQNFGIILFAAYGLPLFSYGGVYLCQTMLLFGLLLSTKRTGQLENGAKPVKRLRPTARPIRNPRQM